MANGGGGFGAQDMGVGEDVGAGFGAGSAAAGIGMDAAEIEAGAGGYSSANELAGALADALAGGDYYDPGAVAAMDAETMATEEGDVGEGVEAQAQAAAQAAYADVMGTSTGPELFGDYNQAVAQGYNFAPAQQGDPTIQGPGSPTQPVDVESFASMPGYGTMATEESDYAETGMMPGTPYDAGEFTGTPTVEQFQMGMAAPMGSGGMLSQGGTFDPNMPESPGTGAITAGTVSPEQAAIEADITAGQDFFGGGNVSGVPDPANFTPGAIDTGGAAGTDFFGDDGNVGQATDSPAGTRMTEEGLNVYGKQQIDKSIMDMSAQLMAKAKADPNGRVLDKNGNPTRYTNQRAANVFNSLDQYSKAYAAMNGGSFLGGLISGAMPFGAAFKAFEGWLTKKGMYSKQTGDDLFAIIQQAMQDGDLNQVVRELGGGGPSDEDVQGPQEIRSFIEQYPWAAELDPKYIKYLIDNPAALQDLLGQGPGGGDQEAPGNQTKPGGGGSNPPAGFTQKPGAATQALVEWSNPATGETWTAPNGGWQGPEGWVIV